MLNELILIETCFTILLGFQVLHSIEELSMKFHERCPFFKMGFKTFLAFEILFLVFWVIVLLEKQFPARDYLMAGFLLLMFANGIWHIVWWGVEKRYVPGIITAPFFVIVFLLFYFRVVL
jgi:hypothetical protein